MNSTKIQAAARPYAEGAYKHARARGELERWEQMLDVLAELASSESLAALVADPKVAPQQREGALRALLAKALGDDDSSGESAGFANFAAQLLAAGRLPAADQIARQFTALRHAEAGIVDVRISSAFPVDDKTMARLDKALARHLGASSVRITVEINDTLGAGMLIKAKDQVIDGTVPAGLERMRLALANV